VGRGSGSGESAGQWSLNEQDACPDQAEGAAQRVFGCGRVARRCVIGVSLMPVPCYLGCTL
jgi:hypothetical protein